jgi:hypothetical protein
MELSTLALLAALVVQAQPGEVRVALTSQLRVALREAKPGARILLATGKYEGFSVSNVAGEATRSIVVSSADPERPAVFTGGVHLSNIAFVELADFVIEGAPANGLNIDDGGALDTPAHHVVLRRLVVRDCGGRGNEDGIKLSGVSDFRLESCTVERWGRGGSGVDMVGCRAGAIVSSTFRDREADPASNGVQVKGGSRDIEVNACRFEHAGQRAVNIGGSTGLPYFRPAPQGFEARDIVVQGCTFVGSLAPIAFVGVDGAKVRFNTFYRPRKWLVRILQETRESSFTPCRNGEFTDNLVVHRAGELAVAVNVGDATAPETFQFARNYWYCENEPARSRVALPVEEREGTGGDDPRFRGAAQLDLRLAPDSPARKHGAEAWRAR